MVILDVNTLEPVKIVKYMTELEISCWAHKDVLVVKNEETGWYDAFDLGKLEGSEM